MGHQQSPPAKTRTSILFPFTPWPLWIGRLIALVLLISWRWYFGSIATTNHVGSFEVYKTRDAAVLIESMQWALTLAVCIGLFWRSARVRIVCIAIAAAQASVSVLLALWYHCHAWDLYGTLLIIAGSTLAAILLLNLLEAELAKLEPPSTEPSPHSSVNRIFGLTLYGPFTRSTSQSTILAVPNWLQRLSLLPLLSWIYLWTLGNHVCYFPTRWSFGIDWKLGAMLVLVAVAWENGFFSRHRSRRMVALGSACLSCYHVGIELAVRAAHDQYYWRWFPATADDYVQFTQNCVLVGACFSFLVITLRTMALETIADASLSDQSNDHEEHWSGDAKWDEGSTDKKPR